MPHGRKASQSKMQKVSEEALSTADETIKRLEKAVVESTRPPALKGK